MNQVTALVHSTSHTKGLHPHMASQESLAPSEQGEKPTKQCSACKKVLPIECFSKNSRTSDKLEYQCRICIRRFKKERISKYGVTVPRVDNLDKKCSKCKKVKPINEFYRCPSSLDGKRGACIPCVLTVNRQSPGQRHRHRQYQRPHAKAYETMVSEQNGLCAICGKPEMVANSDGTTSLCVDHCHTTDRIRNLLCRNCNAGLGFFKDDPDLMRNAADYVEYHRSLGSSLEA